MTIPLNISHHIPPRLLGQLDDEGILICDRWLEYLEVSSSVGPQDAEHRLLGPGDHRVLQDLRPGQGENCTKIQRVQGADREIEKR